MSECPVYGVHLEGAPLMSHIIALPAAHVGEHTAQMRWILGCQCHLCLGHVGGAEGGYLPI